MLDQLKRNDPKAFFAKFSKRKSVHCPIPLHTFYEHFKSISANIDTDSDDNANNVDDTNEVVFEELDQDIFLTEIEKAINNLKRCKAHVPDLLLNGYFIECKDLFLPILHKLFNCILSTGYFLKGWSSAVIVPIFKKGDKLDPNNYRAISLISNLAKLFTNIGFQPGRGIRSLHAIISKVLSSKKRLYCAFIDLKKAFDYIDRKTLWYKCFTAGIKGRLLSVIQSLYLHVQSCVSINGYMSDYFRSNLGLMQGIVMSPVLFALFINDIEINLYHMNIQILVYFY